MAEVKDEMHKLLEVFKVMVVRAANFACASGGDLRRLILNLPKKCNIGDRFRRAFELVFKPTATKKPTVAKPTVIETHGPDFSVAKKSVPV